MAESTINQHIQDCFLYLAVTDTQFLKLVRSAVPAELFTSQVTSDLVTICYNYFDQFESAPNNHLHDEVVKQIAKKTEEDKELYTSYISKISELHQPNVDYIIKTINTFVQARKFEEAAVDFVKLVEKGNFQKAKFLMQEALRSGVERENIGLDYLTSDTPLYYQSKVQLDKLPTGMEKLDMLLKGGLKRGWFVCILGGMKGKKTWSLVHLGKQALMRSLNVCHITHEMDVEEVEERYDRSLGGLTNEDDSVEVIITEMNDKGMVKKETRRQAHSIYNPKAIRRTRRTWRKLGGRLIIRKYPMGTCTSQEIERYLNYLETYYHFTPDILINDYVDIMNIGSKDRREEINQLYIDHKKIADERDILVVTVSQTNRAALLKAKLERTDFAEDIRKLANVDVALAISADELQVQKQEMRVWILGGRSVKDFCGCYIKQNLDIGQFCTDSWFGGDHRNDHDGEEEQ
jgi:replicative DNA helicase